MLGVACCWHCSRATLTGISLNKSPLCIFQCKTSLHAHEDEFFPEKIHKGYSKFWKLENWWASFFFLFLKSTKETELRAPTGSVWLYCLILANRIIQSKWIEKLQWKWLWSHHLFWANSKYAEVRIAYYSLRSLHVIQKVLLGDWAF